MQREFGDKLGIAHALNSLGCVVNNQGHYARAAALFEESLALFRELRVEWGTIYALVNLARANLYLGCHGQAAPLLQVGIVMCRSLGNKDVVAEYVEGFAGLAGAQGRAERAVRLFGAAEALRSDWRYGVCG